MANLKEGWKSLRVFLKLKKTILLVWFFVLVALSMLINFLSQDGRVSALRDVFIFFETNKVLFLIFIIIFLAAFFFVINWNKAGFGWVIKRISFVVTLFMACILYIYRDKMNLTAVQKARIRLEYKHDFDSVKNFIKEDYFNKQKDLKQKFKTQEGLLQEFKERFDSLSEVNQFLTEKMSTTKETDCSLLEKEKKSLSEKVVLLEKEIVVLKKQQSIKINTKTKSKTTSVSTPKPTTGKRVWH